jgi:ribonuclease HI
VAEPVEIHTDGACRGNPGPGGWGIVWRYGDKTRQGKGAEPLTTNNRMELMAAILALEALKRPCRVVLTTDSQYLLRGLNEWLPRWKQRGWRTVDKKPVKNDDLWRRLDQAAARHVIDWRWVKGHSGNPGNEQADRLANEAIDEMLSQATAPLVNASGGRGSR